MIELKIKDKAYKVKYGYKALAKSGVLKQVISIQTELADRNKRIEAEEEERKNKENFPEYNTDELGNPIEVEEDDSENVAEYFDLIEQIMGILPSLILAGLQREHKDEYKVNYSDEEDLNDKLDKVVDLLDDYMDEEDSLDVTDLFGNLTDELFNSGFLFKKSEKLEIAMEKTDSTVTPTDHLRPQN